MTDDQLPPTITGDSSPAPARGSATARRWSTSGSGSRSRSWPTRRRAAAALVASGIEPGDRVAIWAPNSTEWAIAALGDLRAPARCSCR